MNVVIAGENPFVEEVGALCRAAGHDVTLYLVEDFLGAVDTSRSMVALAEAEVVIELHHESAETKHELLFSLGTAVDADTLLLTSVLPVSTTQAAAWVPFPDRVIGFAVLPPLAEQGTVELARGLNSSAAALARAHAFWQSLGYQCEVVGDGPGLVRARVVCCIINEACSAVLENVASPGDIDLAMQLGTNYPHGPLRWADYLGLDTVLGVMQGLYDEWGEDRYRPNPLLRRMVLAGKLGRKVGHGFYDYDGAGD